LAASRSFPRIASKNFQKNDIRLSHSYGQLQNRAFIALGSNMGDRVDMIEQACKMMEATGEVKILQTSGLYETKAMYVLDQDNFVNGACEVGLSFSSRRQPLKSVDSNLTSTASTSRLSSISRDCNGSCQGC
jgi:hypothetical protein